MTNAEGPVSTHVTDATKLQCPVCGGSKIYLSSLMDDGNDITTDTRFAALYVTITGGNICGLVGLCVQCGKEWVPMWYILDIATGAAAAAVTMTNLDASVANGLTGAYAIYLDAAGTDTGLYYVVASNTAAPPTVITMTIATNNDEVGYWMITNILPLGLTAAS